MTEDEQTAANKEFFSKLMIMRDELDEVRSSGDADNFTEKATEFFRILDSIDGRTAEMLSDREYAAYSEMIRTTVELLSVEVKDHTKFILKIPLFANAAAISLIPAISANIETLSYNVWELLLFVFGMIFSVRSYFAYARWKESSFGLLSVMAEGFLRNYFRYSDLKSVNFDGFLKDAFVKNYVISLIAFFTGLAFFVI